MDRNQEMFYSIIMKGGYLGQSLERIVYKIYKESKAKFSRTKIANAILALEKEGKLKLIKVKNDFIVEADDSVVKEGNFYIVNSNKGYIVDSITKERFYVFRDEAKFAQNGESVKYALELNSQKAFVVDVLGKQNDNVSSYKDKPLFTTIEGRVLRDNQGQIVFRPYDKTLKDFAITGKANEIQKSVGHVCSLQVLSSDLNSNTETNVGTLKKIYGKIGLPLVEMERIQSSHGFSEERSQEVWNQTENTKSEININDYILLDLEGKIIQENKSGKVRYDLRNIPFHTIDPGNIDITKYKDQLSEEQFEKLLEIDKQSKKNHNEAKDMDDAVFTMIDKDGNFVNFTAIADVSEVAKVNSPLFNDALTRGFTSYTPTKAIGMFPDKLASEICSLNPNEDKLAVVTITTIDKKTGKRIPEKTKIVEAVIKSSYKLSYYDAENILNTCDYESRYKELSDINNENNAVGKIPLNLIDQIIIDKKGSDAVWKHFKKRNTLEIDTNDEKTYVPNADKTDFTDVILEPHIPSMKIIEAYMINSNESVAEYLTGRNKPTIYRVHSRINEKNVEKLNSLCEVFGIEFNGDISNVGISKLLEEIKESPYKDIITNQLVRTLSRAEYSEKLSSHYGLGSDCYCHFTSPIRRFSDLAVHSVLKPQLRYELLRDNKELNEYITKNNIKLDINQTNISEKKMAYFAEQVTARELESDMAERETSDFLNAVVFEKKINEIYKGNVVNISREFVLIELLPARVSVKVPTSDFVKNKFSLAPNCVAILKNGKVVCSLGSEVEVKISGADRLTSTVYASTDLEKVYVNDYDYRKFIENKNDKKDNKNTNKKTNYIEQE